MKTGPGKRRLTHRENVVPCGHSICLAAEFPIDEASNPNLFARHSQDNYVDETEVSMECVGFLVRVHHGWSVSEDERLMTQRVDGVQ